MTKAEKWVVAMSLGLMALGFCVGGCKAPPEIIVCGAAVAVEARAAQADIAAMYLDANEMSPLAIRANRSFDRIRTLMYPLNAYLRHQTPDPNLR